MLTSHFSYLQTCQLLFALLANSHCLSQAWEQTVSGIVPLSGSLDTIVSVPDCRIAQVFGHGAKWTVEAIHPQRSMASTAGAGLSGSSAFFSLLSRASVEFFVAPGHWKHFNGAVPRPGDYLVRLGKNDIYPISDQFFHFAQGLLDMASVQLVNLAPK